jgi:peptidoglycan/xylan/chitin deacetylase (PgdA/CDA1 family)
MKASSPWGARLRKVTSHIPVSVYRVLFRRGVFLFVYHIISDESLPHVKHLYAYKSPGMFEHDLIYLLKNYTLVSYEQLVAHCQGQTRLKPNSAFLSFDDGYRECFTVVRPLLQKYGVPCTFFITTDLVDNQSMDNSPKVSLCIEKVTTSDEPWKQAAFARLNHAFGRSIKTEQDLLEWTESLKYADRVLIDRVCETLEVDIGGYLKTQKPFMSLDELRILASEGFTIGAHTRSHPLLRQIPAEAIEQEIVESCQVIQKITQADSIPFAFPFNGNGLKWRLLEDIRSRNKMVGYLFDADGIKQHKGSILGRIWADAPELDGNSQSNLPGLLYLAYQEMMLGWLRKFVRVAQGAVFGRRAKSNRSAFNRLYEVPKVKS